MVVSLRARPRFVMVVLVGARLLLQPEKERASSSSLL